MRHRFGPASRGSSSYHFKVMGWQGVCAGTHPASAAKTATTALMARRYGHIGDSARRSAVTVLNDVSAKAGESGHKIGHSDTTVETMDPVSN